jgi:hypothetical protein
MSSIGAMIDQLQAIRAEKRAIEKTLKEIEETYAEHQEKLLALMHSEGIAKATGSRATASVSSSVKPSVEDWDLFYEFIHRNKYFHLLERRPAVLACRELFESKGMIPGVVPFTKETLNLRDL